MSSSEAGSIPPPVSWAQRSNLLYVIIDVECKNISQDITENSFHFKGENALDSSKKYEVTLNFLHPVDTEKWTSKNIGRCLEYTIYKKSSDATYWPSLTTDKTKLHFLKANFSKWKDDSESDDEDNMGGMNFDDNYDQLLNAPSDWKKKFDDFEDDMNDDDSDDNIPSLSQNDEDDDDDNDEKKDKKEKDSKGGK